MDENLRILEREFCPPLDPALVYAISSDFSGLDGLQQARDILEGLKQTALIEQNTDFDPSGSSGDATQSSPSKGSNSSEVESNAGSSRSQTTVTDYTSISNDLSSLALDNGFDDAANPNGGYFKDAQQMDTQDKEQILQGMFPSLRHGIVSFMLKKCDNDFSKATDELLNHVYFENARGSPDETSVAKGIDAFSEDHTVPARGRKGKGKKKKKKPLSSHNTSSSTSPEPPSIPESNVWQNNARDIEFISSRIRISPKIVASEYHKNAASVPITIASLMETEIKTHPVNEGTFTDPVRMNKAIDICEEFSTIDIEHAMALLRLTNDSFGSTQELAEALTAQPTVVQNGSGSTQIIPSYAPVDLSETTTMVQSKSSLPPSARAPTAASLSTSRAQAFTQASEYYRKGKSTPLMKAVAGYYAQQGRDLSTALRAESAAEADALVTSQSTSTQLDLHGVSVENATRIASERVQVWWDGLGEARIPGGGRQGVGEGYRIVTGLGRHSEGGRGKIGPAVVRTLVKAGWKVEVGSGVLTVMGVARRK